MDVQTELCSYKNAENVTSVRILSIFPLNNLVQISVRWFKSTKSM